MKSVLVKGFYLKFFKKVWCILKVELSPSKKKLCYWNAFKNDEKRFLSRLFGHVGKTVWFATSKFMASQPGLQTLVTHMLPNILQSKDNQTMKFGQLIEYNKRNIFVQILCIKWGRETSSRPLFIF